MSLILSYCLPQFYISKISNFLQFTPLQHLQIEQFDIKLHLQTASAIYIFTVVTEGKVLTYNGIHWEIACYVHVLLKAGIAQSV
jgi:hypothetical protein